MNPEYENDARRGLQPVDGFGCGDTDRLEGEFRGFGKGFGAGSARIDTALRMDGRGQGCFSGAGMIDGAWMELCEPWTVGGVPWGLTENCEIIECSPEAEKSIRGQKNHNE